jgi:hypothetical protein
MSSKIETIPDEVQQAFATFCHQNGWTQSEILTMVMIECIKEDTDIVVRVLKQRALRRNHEKWFLRFPYWPQRSQLED